MAGRAARWIRLGLVEPLELHASYAGLAAAQGADAAPILLWGRARTHLCLGQSQGLAELEPNCTIPGVRRPLGGGLVWVDENQYVFVLIAPRRDAPGRPARWFSWALAPVVDGDLVPEALRPGRLDVREQVLPDPLVGIAALRAHPNLVRLPP